jgi:hypothetical protein
MATPGFSVCLFCHTGDWTQGLAPTGQALSHLNHAPSLFVFN